LSIPVFVGEPFVFQVLYLDPTGTPVSVQSPSVTLFRYDETTGARIFLLNVQAMTEVGSSDPGRYVYRYVIPDVLMAGMVLHVEYRSTDPETGFISVTPEVLVLQARSSADTGLRVRFIR
jgi:hypothetical protein